MRVREMEGKAKRVHGMTLRLENKRSLAGKRERGIRGNSPPGKEKENEKAGEKSRGETLIPTKH